MARAYDLAYATGRDSHNPNFLARRAFPPPQSTVISNNQRPPIVTGLGTGSTHRGQVKCKWCTLVMDASRIEDHLDRECAFVPVQCALPDTERAGQECPVKLQGWDRIRAHQKTCAYTPVACPNRHCTAQVSRRSIKLHLEVCPYQRISCQACQARYFRVDQDYHSTVCPEEEITCPLMCGESLRRKYLSHHLQERILSHSYLNLQTGTDYLPPDHPNTVYAMLLKQMKDLKVQSEILKSGGTVTELPASGRPLDPTPLPNGNVPYTLPAYRSLEDSLPPFTASSSLIDERSGLQRVGGFDSLVKEEDLRVTIFAAKQLPSDCIIRITFGDRTLETTRGAGEWNEDLVFPGTRQPPNPRLLVEAVRGRKQIVGAAVVDLTTAKTAHVDRWIPLSWDGRPAGDVHMRIEGPYMDALVRRSGSPSPREPSPYGQPYYALPREEPRAGSASRSSAYRASPGFESGSTTRAASPPALSYRQRYQDVRGLVHALMAAMDRSTQEILHRNLPKSRLQALRVTMEEERSEVLSHANAFIGEIEALLFTHADRSGRSEVRVDNATVMSAADLKAQQQELQTSIKHLEQAWHDMKTALFEAQAW
eukprot:TRINITY_DN5618_c0_g1_i1.p1 TRINITY_DN5618_c0_g1~~TRINITY_DN5618_c0_g1_i1.p1  ORF type:complete len:595 (+),score=59.15 TRINITY_DN5618_c0_g1_i1:47-1831(+)